MYKIYTNNLCRLMRHALNVPLDPEPFMIRFNVPAKRQIIMSIKLTAVFLFLVILQVSATGSAQSLTLKGKSISLKQLFREIRKQTGYDVLYQPDNEPRCAIRPVDGAADGIHVPEKLLRECFVHDGGMPRAGAVL